MSEERLLAGAVEVDITPPIGVPMDGYGARKGNSIGVHDALLAQALLLSLGGERVLLLTLDLLGIGLGFTRRARAQIAEAVDVDETEVMLACTHTHSGPAGFLPRVAGLGAEEDEDLQEITLRKLVGAARWAEDRLQPAEIGVEIGEVTGIGRNRNDPETGPMDPTVTVLRIDDDAGKPLAVLMNYGCHPTVLGYENRYLSADYPGAARRVLQGVYPETVFMFTNGASGDVSTRFTRRSQTFAEVERMGRVLGGEVLRAMQVVETDALSALSSRVAEVEIPVRDFPPPDEAKRVLEGRQAELKRLQEADASHGEIRRATTKMEGARAQVRLAEALSDRTHVATQTQVVSIGGLLLIGLPGEPFTRLVLNLKKGSPAVHTAVISYANDDVGYFPDERSIEEGTYEALSSPYGLAGVRHLQGAALDLVQEGGADA